MKKLMAFLLVAAIALCLFACDEGGQVQTTTQHTGSNVSGESDASGVGSTTTTTRHDRPDHSTTYGDGTSQEGTTDENQSTTQGEDDITTTTPSGQTTTSGQVIVTTTKKGETTKNTTTTTTKTTTTTTKKTTTTTKKTTTTTKKTTVHNHSFNSATYTKVDMNSHKVAGKCSGCGLTTSQTERHSWGSWKYDTYPTATAQGVKYRACSGCREEQVTYVPPTSVNTASFPQEMFELVNAERAKYGLPAFKYYTAGQSGANIRAQELMVYFSHNRPDGSKWWTISSFDKAICQAGAENIARGYGSPEDVLAAFMASGDHRSNLLSTKYTHIVIGYYEGAWVQIFVKPW